MCLELRVNAAPHYGGASTPPWGDTFTQHIRVGKQFPNGGSKTKSWGMAKLVSACDGGVYWPAFGCAVVHLPSNTLHAHIKPCMRGHIGLGTQYAHATRQ